MKRDAIAVAKIARPVSTKGVTYLTLGSTSDVVYFSCSFYDLAVTYSANENSSKFADDSGERLKS